MAQCGISQIFTTLLPGTVLLLHGLQRTECPPDAGGLGLRGFILWPVHVFVPKGPWIMFVSVCVCQKPVMRSAMLLEPSLILL